MSRQFYFKPGYYEWHLTDRNGNILHNMVDPAEDLFNEDGEELTIEEVHSLCYQDLQCADNHYECDEDYNGILLNDLERLDEQEIAEAADVMCDALVDYYFANDPRPGGGT